jgi:hypothetical protein
LCGTKKKRRHIPDEEQVLLLVDFEPGEKRNVGRIRKEWKDTLRVEQTHETQRRITRRGSYSL